MRRVCDGQGDVGGAVRSATPAVRHRNGVIATTASADGKTGQNCPVPAVVPIPVLLLPMLARFFD
jgi:hypothetical protein